MDTRFGQYVILEPVRFTGGLSHFQSTQTATRGGKPRFSRWSFNRLDLNEKWFGPSQEKTGLAHTSREHNPAFQKFNLIA